MDNYEIADQFTLLSKLMDIHGENSFKIKTYSIAAYTIERLPLPITDMDDAELFGIKGIGPSTGKKIRDILSTGSLPQLQEILSITPAGILEMLQIKGLGPKKIAVIWKELGLESLGELEYACNENRLVALKGFGAKTQDSVLQSIIYFRQNQGLHLWSDAFAAAGVLMPSLKAALPDCRFELTADIRRQNEVLEFIDILTDAGKVHVAAYFDTLPDTVISDDADGAMLVRIPSWPALKFHFAFAEDFYNKLFQTTASPEFISSLGSFTLPERAISEEAIFEANGLPYMPPALREVGMDGNIATNGSDQLIQPSDIKGIIHSHSCWSDGVHTIAQMAAAAMQQGFEYLVISDHSQTATYAQGLKPERVAAQHAEIDELNAKLAPFRIFKSIESDILGDGRLDYAPQVLSTFDLVIASVHSNLKMTAEKATERVLAAVQNPFTTILGHPTGRLLLSRKGYPLDHKRIIDACAENNVVIEINAHPRRLDMDWRWIRYAMEKGVLLSIDPDAHTIDGFADVFYGVMTAQKGGLTASSNLSSFTLQAFSNFVAKRKDRIASYAEMDRA